MGLALRKIHSERKGYGRRAERKHAASRARRRLERVDVEAQAQEYRELPHWPWCDSY